MHTTHSNTQYKNESKHSEMGPVRQNPIQSSVTVWHSSSGRQPNFAALNRGRHLYSAGRPSHWALAHILVGYVKAMLQCSSKQSYFCNLCCTCRFKI